jgi:hypothetical protein
LELLQQLKYTPSSLHEDAQCRVQHEENENLKSKGVGDGIWLGQYESYIAHLEEDLIEYARKSSTLPPSTVSSNTPTAASIIFEIDFQSSSHGVCLREEGSLVRPVRAIVSAGKALESREMFVRVRSQSDENCSIVYGVQGGLEKYLGGAADGGPYILLDGACWAQDAVASRIEIPSDWGVLSSACHRDISRSLSRSHLHLDAASVFPRDELRCLLRPNYFFETPHEAPPLPASTTSSKFRNNAYIEIIGALLRNDRSYFTTTEVRNPRDCLFETHLPLSSFSPPSPGTALAMEDLGPCLKRR